MVHVCFDIETDDLEEVSRLIEQQGFGRLKHLKVARRPIQSFWALDPFFKMLHKQAGNMPLKSLRLVQTEFIELWEGPPRTLVPISGVRTFVPLFEFPDMSVPEINLLGSVALNDSGLIGLAIWQMPGLFSKS